jgi:AcrR family transcriptional regulator
MNDKLKAGRARKDGLKRRMPKADRRLQLLKTALLIVGKEGADCLTLGHLAEQAGVSKPVVYDHFGTRSGLLIELYRWIDVERVREFREAMRGSKRSREETVSLLASTYLNCASDMKHEFHQVGTALGGSEEKAAVFQELLDGCVVMFVEILTPHSILEENELRRRCVGLVGAGEALAGSVTRAVLSEEDAAQTFATIIQGTLNAG